MNGIKRGIEILNYALNKNTSITEACRVFKINDRSLRSLRANYSKKSDPDYIKFLELYTRLVNRSASILNKEEENLMNLVDDSDLLSGDTIIEEESLLETENDNVLELDYRGNKIVKTAEEMIQTANVDLNIWKVDKEIVNKWDVTMKLKIPLKDESGKVRKDDKGYPITTQEPATFQNFQVKLFLSKKRTKDQQTAFDEFLQTVRENAPDLGTDSYITPRAPERKKYLLELSLPDLHIGKLSWEDESGENYDTKIAIERYNESIAKLLNHVRHYKNEIAEILLPLGNDLFNVDNKNNMTTAGTPQHVDSRWQQMFMKAKQLMIKNINELVQIAPVKVVMVSGNHDMQTVFYLGSVLEAYYHNTPNVTIDNSPTQRKYHTYGINLIGFTHGNEEKHQDLGLIMATEKPHEWAASKNRQFHLGHFHSRKTTRYLDVQEFQGFTVRVLPSLSGTDAWHNSKGYMSMKSAVAYLYDKDNGLVGEFSHNII